MKTLEMSKVRVYAGRVVEAVLLTGSRCATKFVHPKFVVRATRRMSSKRKNAADGRKDSDSITLSVTIGAPNYRERKFIEDCKAAGERFPVRNIRLRGFPVKR